MTASICYFIKGDNSNFSITIKSVAGKPLELKILEGIVTSTDQTFTLNECIWSSIIEGKIMWNNVQWLCTIKENKPFNNDIRDLIFWLGYYIDLGSRNPEILLDSSILGENGSLIRLKLTPKSIM